MSSELRTSSLSAVDRGRAELDPELVALPAPPKRERFFTLALLALTAVASLTMAYALRGDAAYALGASPRPMALGDLRDAQASAFAEARYVAGRGMLAAASAIRFERPFDSASYRLQPVLGRNDIWVELRITDDDLQDAKGDRQPPARFVPPSSFAGRLVAFDAAGIRHRGLAQALESVTGQPPPPQSYLLIDGEAPATSRWAAALLALFVGFAIWNFRAIYLLMRSADSPRWGAPHDARPAQS